MKGWEWLITNWRQNVKLRGSLWQHRKRLISCRRRAEQAKDLNYKDNKAPAKVTFSTLEKLLSQGQGPWWGRVSPDMSKSMPWKVWTSQMFTESWDCRSGLFLPIKRQPSLLSWRNEGSSACRTAFSHVSIHRFSVFMATGLEIRARLLYNMLGSAGLRKEGKNYTLKGCW